MLILMITYGSIGRRRIHNLKAIKAGSRIACDVDSDKLSDVGQGCIIKIYDNFEKTLTRHPEVALISTSINLHITSVVSAARQGCRSSIEKPLSHSLDSINELIDVTNKKQ